MSENEIKAVKAVEAFLETELSDYSYFKGWKVIGTEDDGDKVYVDAKIRDQELRFKVENFDGDIEQCKISIEMYEEIWESIVTYDWRVKYFWMKVRWE